MPYIVQEKRSENFSTKPLVTSKTLLERNPESVLFYELEQAVVLDIILDDTHPEFSKHTVDSRATPKNIDGSNPTEQSPDYSWIGRIKFRLIHSHKGQLKEDLPWAIPADTTGCSEYPLLNEIVTIACYNNVYYYSKRNNFSSTLNCSADFSAEPAYGLNGENISSYTKKPYQGPVSQMSWMDIPTYTGVLGEHFKFNKNIRALRRFEGDTIIESRFGSSIRFSSYTGDKEFDSGVTEDYTDGGGNPSILIRNRQATVARDGTPANKFSHGYVTESIQNDGSSIHITSGKTVSGFSPTTKKEMLQAGKSEEQPEYSPTGITGFKYPMLDGDQIVINSDRLIFSSKRNETLMFAKKRFSIVTDGEFTIDSHDKSVITSNKSTTINAPKIYLGQHGAEDEPVLLGRTSVYWMYQLCNLLINTVDLLIDEAKNWHVKHIHDLTIEDHKNPTLKHKFEQKPPTDEWAQRMEDYASRLNEYKQQLIELRDTLPTLMSTRVFTVGGGGEPGYDGGELQK